MDEQERSPWNVRHRAPEVLHSSMVCDLYQDRMRINIRRDPIATATVFLPTGDPRIVTRILWLMRGVALVMPNGRVVRKTASEETAAA